MKIVTTVLKFIFIFYTLVSWGEVNAQQLMVAPDGRYFIMHGNTLEQFDTLGIFIGKFSDRGAEAISHADVSDPIDILLFYRDLQMVSILNPRLVMRSESVFLSSYSWFDISAMIWAPTVGYWMYDNWNQKLILIDYNYKALATSGWLRLLLKKNEAPRSIYSTLDRVVLHFPETGILIFNSLGQMVDQIAVANIDLVYLNGDNLYYTMGAKIWNYNLSTKRRLLLKTELPEKVTDFGIANNKLYIMKGNVVQLISLEQPR